MTMDSSARRLSTNMSGSSQGAQGFGEGLAVIVVGDGRTAAHDVDQLVNLVLPNVDDVPIHLIRAAAYRHERQQRAPAFLHCCSEHRVHWIAAQRTALFLEFLDSGQNS